MKLKTYALRWLKEKQQLGEARYSTTKSSYTPIVYKYIIPLLGSRELRRVKRPDVKAFLMDSIHDGSRNSSIKTRLSVLKSLFQSAVEDGYLEMNPALGMVAKRGEPKKQTRVWTHAQVCAFTDEAFTRLVPEAHLLATMALTGIRLGEALALTWEDVVLQPPSISISKSVYNRKVYPTKSGETRRVDISTRLSSGWRGVFNAHTANSLLFHKRFGNLLGTTNVRRVFRKFISTLGLPTIRVHDLRHTWATVHLRELHSPVQWVSAQLGHSSIAITVDLYGHPEVETSTEFASKL